MYVLCVVTKHISKYTYMCCEKLQNSANWAALHRRMPFASDKRETRQATLLFRSERRVQKSRDVFTIPKDRVCSSLLLSLTCKKICDFHYTYKVLPRAYRLAVTLKKPHI